MEQSGEKSKENAEPSLVPGAVLLGIAAVLIVVVIATRDAEMASWLRTTIATTAIAVVVALLAYAAWMMSRMSRMSRRGRK